MSSPLESGPEPFPRQPDPEPFPFPADLEPCQQVRREVDIDAAPEQVWDALATEEGREAWLEPDPERELEVEHAEPPERLVWWWWRGDEQPRKVELQVVAVPWGSRVIVTESEPQFPLPQLCASFARSLVLA